MGTGSALMKVVLIVANSGHRGEDIRWSLRYRKGATGEVELGGGVG